MRIAVLCSAHGFGHLTRQLALVAPLRAAGADEVVIFTAAPAVVIEEFLLSLIHISEPTRPY